MLNIRLFNGMELENAPIYDVLPNSISTKKEGIKPHPNFLNEACKIGFNVDTELERNRRQLESFQINEIMDYSVKTTLLLKRIDLLKLKEIKDALKPIITTNRKKRETKRFLTKLALRHKNLLKQNNNWLRRF